MGLNDFRPDKTDFDDTDPQLPSMETPIESDGFHEEINTLRIDKLSNRVTIISIIIPCLIFAILAFAYVDMKERVVDVDMTKRNQVEAVSKQLESKINALDVKIAKNRYDLDNSLPDIEKKQVSIEGQLSRKAEASDLKNEMAKIDQRIKANVRQARETNKETVDALKQSQTRVDEATRQIKSDIALFKEEFDARLLELSEYEQQIGELRKDLSLMDKKIKTMAQEQVKPSRVTALTGEVSTLSKKLDLMQTDFNHQISVLQKAVRDVSAAQAAAASSDSVKKSKPPAPPAGDIKKQPLAE